MTVYESFSEEMTFNIGKELGKKADKGEIICLEGDLGVGKTVFTKGFAEGLDIEDNIDSPTFTIVQEYLEGRLPLYHFDVYRIGDISEMDEIGYEDYFFGDGVCLIEWASRIKELIPKSAVHIKIEKDLAKGFECRRVVVEE